MNRAVPAILSCGLVFAIACQTAPMTQSTESEMTAEQTESMAGGEYRPTPLDTDPALVGWWKFDAQSGSVAADASSNGHDAKLLGELSFDSNSVPGQVGRALKFPGNDESYVQVTGYKGIEGTKPRSVVAWIKHDEGEGDIVSWGTPEGGKMFNFTFVRDRVGTHPQGGYLYFKEFTNDGEWHHVAVVVEETESEEIKPNLYDHVNLYLDGERAVIDDIGVLDLWPIDNGSELDVRIGIEYGGAVDDVRIYGRPLTIEEIQTIYNAQK